MEISDKSFIHLIFKRFVYKVIRRFLLIRFCTAN